MKSCVLINDWFTFPLTINYRQDWPWTHQGYPLKYAWTGLCPTGLQETLEKWQIDRPAITRNLLQRRSHFEYILVNLLSSHGEVVGLELVFARLHHDGLKYALKAANRGAFLLYRDSNLHFFFHGRALACLLSRPIIQIESLYKLFFWSWSFALLKAAKTANWNFSELFAFSFLIFDFFAQELNCRQSFIYSKTKSRQ